MTKSNQAMVERALAALERDAPARAAAGAAGGEGAPPVGGGARQTSSAGASAPATGPNGEASASTAADSLLRWLSTALVGVLSTEGGGGASEEQLLPVVEYMLSMQDEEDLLEFAESALPQHGASEDDAVWLGSSLIIQRERVKAGRALATNDELDEIWNGGDEVADAEMAANAASAAARLSTPAEPEPEPKPELQGLELLAELALRLGAAVRWSAGGVTDGVFQIEVRVTATAAATSSAGGGDGRGAAAGKLLAAGRGRCKEGTAGWRLNAKLQAAGAAIQQLPALDTLTPVAAAKPAPPTAPAYEKIWMELSPDQKRAAISLGWKMANWDEGAATAVCKQPWGRLNAAQRKSAVNLGYDADVWAEEWGTPGGAESAAAGEARGAQPQSGRSREPGAAADARLLADWQRKQREPAYQKMQAQRRGLPAHAQAEQLVETIQGARVVVCSGETGCGKTTQVPQFVLDDAVKNGRGGSCNIICTQPRRISAMAVADRVANERSERTGQTVGYSIRLEAKTSAATRLLFCTTGILLRRLSEDPDLVDPPVSHIFVDEVHERSEESDFLLMVLRDLILRKPGLKLVLMSATLNSELFRTYFGPQTPIVTIPGRTFPVTELFLEDALEVTEHGVSMAADWAKKRGGGGGRGGMQGGGEAQSVHDIPDMECTEAQLAGRYQGYSPNTITSLSKLDTEAIDYDLIRDVVLWIMETNADVQSLSTQRRGVWGKERTKDEKQKGGSKDGAILVFLPGLKEIMSAHETLADCAVFQQGANRDWLLPLHSTLSSEDQRKIFNRPPPGVTKVVLATNIAETSITIDDVVFVVDTGRMKETRYDPDRKMASLEECLVSRANAKQRAGRAGRVRPGLAIHLFTSHTAVRMPHQQLPEIKRVPLEQLCLRIKVLGFSGGIRTVLVSTTHTVLLLSPFRCVRIDLILRVTVCARACVLPGLGQNKLVEPPDPQAVAASIASLEELQALRVVHPAGRPLEEELTALGHHLARLPVDARIGKMLIYGAMFCCLDPVLTIAAALSYRSPFVAPFDKRDQADAAKMSFATEGTVVCTHCELRLPAASESDRIYTHVCVCVCVCAYVCVHVTSGSDHLTLWTAYREWDKLSMRDKFGFCRDNFLSHKSLQMLSQMKRQFLELLSDSNFVPSGLHSRKVEAAGKMPPGQWARQNRQGGGSGGGGGGGGCYNCGQSGHIARDCPKAKTGGSGGGGRGGLRDGCADVLGWANEQAENVSLIKSVSEIAFPLNWLLRANSLL
jgi:HrpA-like RNA helicase